jgi:hypothetical protein
MGFRFQLRKKIAPGLTLNLGKKSASLRVGVRGAGHTMGTTGQRTTVGAPGTGMFYTHKHDAVPRGGVALRLVGVVVVVIAVLVAARLVLG